MPVFQHVVRVALQVLLRTAVLALGLVAYDRGYDQVITPTPGDADIGKGLLAFLLVVGVSLVWAFVDGLRNQPLVWLVVWAVTALGVGVGWEYAAGLVDDSRENAELGVDLFFAQLVLWPAYVSAGFAWLISYRTRGLEAA
ncbi:hypothetical protein [Nocardioides dilutus]